MTAPLTLDPSTAVEYLRQRNIIGPESASATTLGGGVSNTVVRVDAGEESLVLKQPYPNLNVNDDWPADISRVHNEAAAAHAYDEIIKKADFDDVRVPQVVFESHEDHIIVIACAPDTTSMWKRDLLAGDVDERIAALLGRFLGIAHRRAAEMDELRESFHDKTPFDQLRVDPYHRTTARRHPELADPILAEAERMLATDRTLVHGDYSPKNILVGDKTWVLDFEVAHWGDPIFDVAFMLNHLFIKAIHVVGAGKRLREAALAFWQRYDRAVDWEIERDTVTELAVLMLARVDGKSPVEYINTETGERLRTIASRGLCEDIETISGFADIVREEERA
jgi:aminoglycoside phosphotransferase (APT) family kinase protein